MEVERKGDNVFTPIVITLETKEEAESMKHVMNCRTGLTLEAYCKDGTREPLPYIGKIQNLKAKLYACLDKY